MTALAIVIFQGYQTMNRNTCWYCNKQLIEPLTTYQRRHRKKKMRVSLTVHTECYKALNRAVKTFKPVAPGSVTQ